jgi:NAD-dependent SIR2 family protein deacetylase
MTVTPVVSTVGCGGLDEPRGILTGPAIGLLPVRSLKKICAGLSAACGSLEASVDASTLIMTTPSDDIEHAARLIAGADSLLITAGAGMGVDSGLPDFRGAEGFWKAHPALGQAGIRFEAIASPASFKSDPALAWGFYGHRLTLYRETVPHAGFSILLQVTAHLPHGCAVYTSNVDGQFQKAGFAEERILECHGSIHHLQCLNQCTDEVWSAAGFNPQVDEQRCRLLSAPPRCPMCGSLERPNILMFGDWGWNAKRTQIQQQFLHEWQAEIARPVVIELGAGSAIPSARRFGESFRCPVIRINPREPDPVPQDGVSLPMGALEALTAIASALGIGT